MAHGLQVHQAYLELHVHVCVCMRNSLHVVQESELHEAIHCLVLIMSKLLVYSKHTLYK